MAENGKSEFNNSVIDDEMCEPNEQNLRISIRKSGNYTYSSTLVKPKWDGTQPIRRYVERQTEEVVMMLGQEDNITDWRWLLIDAVICKAKGI